MSGASICGENGCVSKIFGPAIVAALGAAVRLIVSMEYAAFCRQGVRAPQPCRKRAVQLTGTTLNGHHALKRAL